MWRLVDFQSQLDAEQRAGLEAALEVSGLLDAWLSPDGALTDASGARLVLAAARQLQRTGGRYALVTMCVGVGQGVAMAIERTGDHP